VLRNFSQVWHTFLSQGSGMASAAIWLEELGIPPREVCLDWAWQIQTEFANRTCAADEEITTIPWQRIEVSDNGELVLPSDLQKYSHRERLQELLLWAQGEVSSMNSSSSPPIVRKDVERELRLLTNNYLAGFAEESIHPAPLSQTVNSSDEIPQTLFDAKGIRSKAKAASRNSKLDNQIVFALRQHWLITSIASVVLIGAGCFFALSAGTSKVNSSKPVEVSGEKSKLHSDHTASASAADLDNDESLATITEMPQFGVIEPEVYDIPQVTMPSVSSSMLAGRDAKGPTSSESVGVGNGNTSTDTDTQPVEAQRSESSPTETAESELRERNVMQELETLTKTAASNAVESDLAVRDAENSSDVSEPLMLHTSPMVQTQKLAAKIRLRPRQPVWQILLSVDDEFELTPKEPQDVTDRQFTTWLLADSDSKSPKVRLVLQAQAAPGRQTALKWRIFAGAEDLPDLMLPLDKEILQPLQERLRIFTPMAEREVERLKQLASSSERDVRAVLSKQRAGLESQVKFATRLTTVIAEAQLLDDLLRSQLTLYAKLRDGADPEAPTLLQFGDPRDLEQVKLEPKPEVAE
jgi:hypothetical protein